MDDETWEKLAEAWEDVHDGNVRRAKLYFTRDDFVQMNQATSVARLAHALATSVRWVAEHHGSATANALTKHVQADMDVSVAEVTGLLHLAEEAEQAAKRPPQD